MACGYWKAGVASIVLCKSLQRVFSPVVIHSVKEAKEDAFATARRGEGAHGANAIRIFYLLPAGPTLGRFNDEFFRTSIGCVSFLLVLKQIEIHSPFCFYTQFLTPPTVVSFSKISLTRKLSGLA